jgi:hypothetical protein
MKRLPAPTPCGVECGAGGRAAVAAIGAGACTSDGGDGAAAHHRPDPAVAVEQLHLRELGTDERVRLSRAWATTQARFVDAPPAAIAEAQSLVDEAMSARGYPMGDFAQRAADISVDHPNVVSNYRAARAIADENELSQADTESLRQAMVHYRALFDDLLGGRIEDTKLDDPATSRRTGKAPAKMRP